jgi:hypothetical protein
MHSVSQATAVRADFDRIAADPFDKLGIDTTAAIARANKSWVVAPPLEAITKKLGKKKFKIFPG